MKEAKEIAAELSKGNVKKAYELRGRLLRNEGDDFELEIMEIAKQAVITYLKNGRTEEARQVQKLFDLPEDLMEETIQQAVLSSFCDGNVMRIRELKEDLPIHRELSLKIMAYCASWGKKDMTALMETVFA